MHDYEQNNFWWVWLIVIIIVIIVIIIFAYNYSSSAGCQRFLKATGLNYSSSQSNQGSQNQASAEDEVRMVIFPEENVHLCLELSGDAEVPPVKTSGKGKGTVKVNSDKGQIEYDIYVKKLSSSIDLDIGAHFHRSGKKENGPVIKDLNIEKLDKHKYRLKGVWAPNDTSQPLTQKDLDDLLRGEVYVNVHTENYPNGEVRGQVCA
jgi:hypothetical protein